MKIKIKRENNTKIYLIYQKLRRRIKRIKYNMKFEKIIQFKSKYKKKIQKTIFYDSINIDLTNIHFNKVSIKILFSNKENSKVSHNISIRRVYLVIRY